jgi:hypothetical protein
MRKPYVGFIACCISLAATTQIKADENEFLIELKNHTFQPRELIIPANKKVKITIVNLDPEPEEFDSFDLNREKVLFPNRKSRIFVGPLKPGTYEYFGEFHPNTARGKIIVKSVIEPLEQNLPKPDNGGRNNVN